LVFEKIIKEIGLNKEDILAVGDNWENNLAPANAIGIKTVLIAKNKSGNPGFCFNSVLEFIKYFFKVKLLTF
jgi:FMN phosphatase YigB (HAD superfamily)